MSAGAGVELGVGGAAGADVGSAVGVDVGSAVGVDAGWVVSAVADWLGLAAAPEPGGPTVPGWLRYTPTAITPITTTAVAVTAEANPLTGRRHRNRRQPACCPLLRVRSNVALSTRSGSWPGASASSHALIVSSSCLSPAITQSSSGQPQAETRRRGEPHALLRSRSEVVIGRCPRVCREFALFPRPRTRCGGAERLRPVVRA